MAFGKGREIKDLPTSKGILKYVTDLDIFELYLGSIPTKPISSPLREDTKPSFSLFMSKEHGKVFFKDHATGDSGDCFLFVMRLFRLRTKIAVFNKIASDFKLDEFDIDQENSFVPFSIKKTERGNKMSVKSRLRMSVTIRSWKVKDKDYWLGKYHLGIKQLEYCKIFPISHYFINGSATIASELAYVFVEEKDGLQTFKIYQPKSVDDKWINNNDFSTWELWTQLPDKGKILIITSSRKDAAVIKSLFPSEEVTSCSLQSENVKAKKSVTEELKSRFDEVFVMYDNDFNSEVNRGRVAGEKFANTTGFLQIEIPEKYKAKDPSDYVEKFGKKELTNTILELIRSRLREEELKQIR